MKFAFAQESRIGARRENQDRIGSWRTDECLVLAVADGLGGHAHGEIAAQIAIDVLAAAFANEAKPKLADPGKFLVRAIAAAHGAILREGDRRNLDDTPRTVLVACVIQDGRATWTHVGDCRLYLLREGKVLRRTRDHSVVQRLLDEGRIREEAIAFHPDRNRLLQCLGSYQAPRPDAPESALLAKNDGIVLCSDGFWGPLTQRQMLHALLSRPLESAIPELVQLAERRAGPSCDNVSVIAGTLMEESARVDEVTPVGIAAAAPAVGAATEIQDLTATDPDFMRMSDEDIAKAIEELKNALRKNTP